MMPSNSLFFTLENNQKTNNQSKDIVQTCNPFSWALCSISSMVETSSSEGPSSWRRNISSKARSTCNKCCTTMLIMHSFNWPITQVRWTYQCVGDIWITREIYTNIPTNITSFWRFITTKEYRNAGRVYLECNTWYKESAQIKLKITPNHLQNTCMHTWPYLKRRTWIILVSRSLLRKPTKWMSSIYHKCKNRRETTIIKEKKSRKYYWWTLISINLWT